jgi:flagellar biosynthetic protein FliR
LFFDPGSSGQTAVLSEFLGVLGTLVFLALNGHLMMISVLSASFELLPIAIAPLSGRGFEMMVRWGAVTFAAGVLLAIPLIVTLLITNIALLVLTRAAPQLNLFAVGFPISLTVGFGVLLLSLPLAAPLLERLFEQGLAAMEQYVRAAAPGPI